MVLFRAVGEGGNMTRLHLCLLVYGLYSMLLGAFIREVPYSFHSSSVVPKVGTCSILFGCDVFVTVFLLSVNVPALQMMPKEAPQILVGVINVFTVSKIIDTLTTVEDLYEKDA